MSKIIVRENILGRGHVNSALINVCRNKKVSTFDQLQQLIGIKRIMVDVFKEDIAGEDITQSDLYSAFIKAEKEGVDNDTFKHMYRVDENFAVHLSANIYLYHLVAKDSELYPSFLPWFYADSKVFLGDTWWESDEEILNNIRSLSILEFLKRYKGY